MLFELRERDNTSFRVQFSRRTNLSLRSAAARPRPACPRMPRSKTRVRPSAVAVSRRTPEYAGDEGVCVSVFLESSAITVPSDMLGRVAAAPERACPLCTAVDDLTRARCGVALHLRACTRSSDRKRVGAPKENVVTREQWARRRAAQHPYFDELP
jgi:hypothetical protein